MRSPEKGKALSLILEERGTQIPARSIEIHLCDLFLFMNGYLHHAEKAKARGQHWRKRRGEKLPILAT